MGQIKRFVFLSVFVVFAVQALQTVSMHPPFLPDAGNDKCAIA